MTVEYVVEGLAVHLTPRVAGGGFTFKIPRLGKTEYVAADRGDALEQAASMIDSARAMKLFFENFGKFDA